ncbi:MAG: hypothetical protein KGY51_11810 [Psychroflexus sp.]|nr:hypothetical protein [Psychroflexus sp.]
MDLHLITSKDDLRPPLKYIKVTKENCVATNAHVIGVIPTTDIFSDEFIEKVPEEGFILHPEDWKKLKNNTDIVWKSNDVIKISYSKKRDALIEIESESNIGKFPNWEAILPSEYAETQPLPSIGINMKLAYDLQKAIGSDKGLKLDFYGVAKGVVVKPIRSTSKAYGLIMPIITS